MPPFPSGEIPPVPCAPAGRAIIHPAEAPGPVRSLRICAGQRAAGLPSGCSTASAENAP